ncbi:MFS transporter [Yinghuangia aomiensis]
MALGLLPAGLVVAFGSPFTGKLINRYGTAPFLAASMASLSLGYLWFLATAGTTPNYAFSILPSMLLLGGGFAFGFASIMSQATEGIDDSEQGLASGLVQTSGQVGAALVLAVVTALTSGATPGDTDFQVVPAGRQPGHRGRGRRSPAQPRADAAVPPRTPRRTPVSGGRRKQSVGGR